jgi:hypothetical protein
MWFFASLAVNLLWIQLSLGRLGMDCTVFDATMRRRLGLQRRVCLSSTAGDHDNVGCGRWGPRSVTLLGAVKQRDSTTRGQRRWITRMVQK